MEKDIVVGIDVGGTNTELGFVNADGAVLVKETIPTRSFAEFKDFVDSLVEMILTKIESNHFSGRVKAIGVGAPNGNYYKGTIEHAPNLQWKGILPFVKMLEDSTQLKVVLTNDANAAAMGESIYGGAKGMKDFVVITLGTGLGSGIVCDGKVLYGQDGFAGELGHTIVDIESNRLCGCGRYGCLETYVSATGIVNTAKEMLENTDVESILRKISPELLTSINIAKAVHEKDLIASMSFDFTAKILALALANLTAITSPEAIFITGGLAKAGDILFNPLHKYYDEFVMQLFKGKTKILPSQLQGENTGMLGAAALAFGEFE